MNQISITDKTDNKKIKNMAEKIIKKALRFLKQKDIRVDVYLVTDSEMKKINAKFRGENKVTNVLTFREPKFFPHPEILRDKRQATGNKRQETSNKRQGTMDRGQINYLGEMYLAPDYIKSKKEDMNLMVVHGILHLLGYTHGKKNDKIKMEAMERKLLKNF